ncbi:MAG: SAM-dependent methyltransferase [Rhodospirillaceae bacterium]|nr:SAM-dependent methyltransferase [Rhodospirillaceae bacterium]|tara:strand:- start:505 stop:1173 length:669 start_codon:yes stop_codon:yes gene_type:complete
MIDPIVTSSQEVSTVDDRLHWPAPERNKDAILQVLREYIPHTPGQDRLCLEVAAGSGQHAAHFAARLPDTIWQASDPDPHHLASIQAWLDRTGLTKTPKPLCLDTRNRPWPIQSADAVLCINMIHISPWESCISLFDEASNILSREGVVYLYGPFTIGGKHISPSNTAFDESLKSQDTSWGVRDLNEVSAVARQHGFRLSANLAMPANNLSVIFRQTHQKGC